ncbi:MAG: hypothetical protein ACRDPH_16170 [Marmoricola sp.]
MSPATRHLELINPPAGGPRDRVDLVGLDFYTRRDRLMSSLRDLRPGQGLELACEPGEDLSWLRFEIEHRVSDRYRWSLPREIGEAALVVVSRPGAPTGRDLPVTGRTR